MKTVFVFAPDRYYKHTTGRAIHTLQYVKTHMYGVALIAEDDMGKLYPVGLDPANAVNYTEITKEEYEGSFPS